MLGFQEQAKLALYSHVGTMFVEGILVEIPSTMELSLVRAFGGRCGVGFPKG